MSDRRDTYLGFAGHYDVHGWDWYCPTYGPRLFRLMEERGIHRARVLDAGCGTGTMALALAERGFQVTGIDLSEAMLTEARRKDVAGKVTWRQADITRFDLSGLGQMEAPFDLIICVADTLNHLENLDDWEAAFLSFAAHLKPGGHLFFDVMTSRGLQGMDKISVADAEDRTLILAVIYESGARRSTLKATSFVPVAGTALHERASETITEWAQPVSGIMERLARSGFHQIERLWSNVADPEREDRLSALARRI